MSYQRNGIARLTKDWLKVYRLFFPGDVNSLFLRNCGEICPPSLSKQSLHVMLYSILPHHLHQRVSNLHLHRLFPKIIHPSQNMKSNFGYLHLGDSPKDQFVLPLLRTVYFCSLWKRLQAVQLLRFPPGLSQNFPFLSVAYPRFQVQQLDVAEVRRMWEPSLGTAGITDGF